MENKQTYRNGRDRLRPIIIILLLLILFLIIGLIIARCGKSESPQADGGHGGGVELQIDPAAGEYSRPDRDSAAQSVAIPGWGSITIPANTTDIAVDFFNPEVNAGLYYLTFELRLPDDSEQGYEVLYTSGLVEPGLHIQSAILSRGLDAGEYEAVIHVQPYRMDEYRTPTNNADMMTVLKVK